MPGIVLTGGSKGEDFLLSQHLVDVRIPGDSLLLESSFTYLMSSYGILFFASLCLSLYFVYESSGQDVVALVCNPIY
jgi:hypothetical protein